MPDQTDMVRRLAFIRYLYGLAVEQSRQPEPQGAASILTFHDSVELFLQLACEHLDAGGADVPFMEYWEILRPKLPNDGLTQKVSMKRLNKARVGLKHQGILPSVTSIESLRGGATSFFEENTPIVFGVEFASISMLNLVQCAEAKATLIKSEKLFDEGKVNDAFTEMATAFHQLVDFYVEKKWTRLDRSFFHFGEVPSYPSDFLDRNQDRGFRDFADDTEKCIEAMQKAMRIIALGLDYPRYLKFISFMPFVGSTEGDTLIVQHLGGSETPSVAWYGFCRDFVVESAIRLQEFDYDVETG